MTPIERKARGYFKQLQDVPKLNRGGCLYAALGDTIIVFKAKELIKLKFKQ